MGASSPPAVTVGLPTYNRAGRLVRAIESVLSQTHADLELLISDNASTDDTAQVCARYGREDARVRYVRHSQNVGLTANFNSVFHEARGRYVMALADDDWLEPEYVQRCAEALSGRDDHVLVSGLANFFEDGRATGPGAAVDALDDEPARRVRSYFAQVRDNPSIYGLIRREALLGALPMRNCLAGDWLLVGRLAMAGKVATLTTTHVNRSVGGTSESYARTAARMGLTRGEARHPHLAMARLIYEDIARNAPAYDTLRPAQRRALARRCAWAILRGRPLNVVEDALRPYLDRPPLSWVDRVARPVARRIQR